MREDKILRELKKINKRLDGIDENVAFLNEQSEFMRENMVMRDEYLHGQDQLLSLFKRLDEDRVFTHTRIRRVEDVLAI